MGNYIIRLQSDFTSTFWLTKYVIEYDNVFILQCLRPHKRCDVSSAVKL